MNDVLLLKEVAHFVDDRILSNILDVNSYISTENLMPNKAGVKTAHNLPPNNSKSPAYKCGDILISNIRPYLKKIWFSNKDGGCSADVLVLRAKNGINPKFLYYALFRDDFFVHAMKGAKGTKMPRGDKSQILEFSIPKFDLEKQNDIATFLSMLDSKIDCNNRINAELESMVSLVYDYWFMQFNFPNSNGKPYKSSNGIMVYNDAVKREIPQGWDAVPLARWIAKDKTGDWGKEAPEGNHSLRVSCIRGTDLSALNSGGAISAPVRYILPKNNSKLLTPFDFVIEISGGSPTQSTGRISNIIPETLSRFSDPIICSNFCKAISLYDNSYYFNFAYLWKTAYDNGVLFGWEGKTSGIKNLLFDAFTQKFYVPTPPKSIANKFFEFVSPIESKRQLLCKENDYLKATRDWLLPMLMNRQVTVS